MGKNGERRKGLLAAGVMVCMNELSSEEVSQLYRKLGELENGEFNGLYRVVAEWIHKSACVPWMDLYETEKLEVQRWLVKAIRDSPWRNIKGEARKGSPKLRTEANQLDRRIKVCLAQEEVVGRWGN
eukprot:TRINITY_DN4760_c0_g1_i1.p2 TRINITY_DN4760_c0_g1~~TRINITY_DN4760_c0_g1_i1.p2  ORF type:complete len:127 (-),score=13.38 TRINITY_DN4760_c0_g1_i1:499-879(-)